MAHPDRWALFSGSGSSRRGGGTSLTAVGGAVMATMPSAVAVTASTVTVSGRVAATYRVGLLRGAISGSAVHRGAICRCAWTATGGGTHGRVRLTAFSAAFDSAGFGPGHYSFATGGICYGAGGIAIPNPAHLLVEFPVEFDFAVFSRCGGCGGLTRNCGLNRHWGCGLSESRSRSAEGH